jgi:hypothetical protein
MNNDNRSGFATFNEDTQKIEEQETKIQELERKLEEISSKVKEIENEKEFQLHFPMDEQSRKVLKDVISEQILDVVWNDYYYFSSIFDSIDRYFVTGTAAAETINDSGLYLETNGTGSNEGSVFLFVSSDLINVEHDARLRIINQLDSVTNVNWSGLTLVDSVGNSYVGFEMNSGSIIGVTSKAGTKTSVTLGTYTANTNVELELHFSPSRVTFFVNRVEKGVSTTNIPTADPVKILEIGIGETSAAARSSTTTSFEFIQRKI